jgi:hypothetical protein
MKSVYVVSKNLQLYSDVGLLFSPLQESKDITGQELLNAFPSGSFLIVYFSKDAAETELRRARTQLLVEDDNPLNAKGFTYRSKSTPVLLEVQLKDNLEVNQDETQRTMSKEMFNFNVPVKIINLEKDHKGQMPEEIMLNTNKEKMCAVM